jgi:hypothetical protein
MADRVEEVVAATRSEVHSPDFHHFTLDTVRLMLSEWVPMGGNAIVALNDRLGVSERVQGGFFTAAVDEHPSATLYQARNYPKPEVHNPFPTIIFPLME